MRIRSEKNIQTKVKWVTKRGGKQTQRDPKHVKVQVSPALGLSKMLTEMDFFLNRRTISVK